MAEYGVWTAILVIYARGGTTTAGLIAVVQLLPAAVVAPLSGRCHRPPRRRFALALGYVFEAVSMGATGGLIVGGAPSAVVYTAAVVAASGLTLDLTAQASPLASLVEHPDELTGGHGGFGVGGECQRARRAGPAGLRSRSTARDWCLRPSPLPFGGSLVLVSRLSRRGSPAEAAGDDDASRDDGVLAGSADPAPEAPTRALVVADRSSTWRSARSTYWSSSWRSRHSGSARRRRKYFNAAFGLGATAGGLAAVGLIGARSIARSIDRPPRSHGGWRLSSSAPFAALSPRSRCCHWPGSVRPGSVDTAGPALTCSCG